MLYDYHTYSVGGVPGMPEVPFASRHRFLLPVFFVFPVRQDGVDFGIADKR